MMFNLKIQKGPYKEIISELVFILSNKDKKLRLYHPNFTKFLDFCSVYSKILENNISTFLNENWFSFDCIGIKHDKLILYEIKLDKINKISAEEYKLYKFAQELGIETKLVKIEYLNNWNFKINIEELIV